MKSSVEESTSWELFQARGEGPLGGTAFSRRRGSTAHRLLKGHPTDSSDLHKVKEDTEHGMMIDAGSQGTRIHVYEFPARVLTHRNHVKHVVQGRKLTFPSTDSRWTDRLKPGLDAFAFIEDEGSRREQVRAYLQPLIGFAEEVLETKRHHWLSYPIYLKATGGLRTLPRPYRTRLVETTRSLFRNSTFNPFFFEDEHARVISGEEEAIYGWAAVNFVTNTLIANSEGSGEVLAPNVTYGVLEMGGASTQIGFFEPNGDVMANLFKLQIGAAKHWNVYAHSFLYFGVNGAFSRLNAQLVQEAELNQDRVLPGPIDGVYNPCLPVGSQYRFTSRIHVLPDGSLLPLSSPENASTIEAKLYSAIMRNNKESADFGQCVSMVKLLLRMEANSWWYVNYNQHFHRFLGSSLLTLQSCLFCMLFSVSNFSHDRDCSFAGIYQPPLPINEYDFGEFIATSNFYHVWDFLGLEERSTVDEVLEGARHVCTMNITKLNAYNQNRPKPLSDDDLIQYCFRATFVAELFRGWGFPGDYHITSVDQVNGLKLGWALGSMLYEINTLPWAFESKHTLKKIAPKLLGSAMPEDDFEPHEWVLVILVVGMVLSASVWAATKIRRRSYRNTRLTAFAPESASLATPRIGRRQPQNYGATEYRSTFEDE